MTTVLAFPFPTWLSSSLGHQHNLSKIALSYGYTISPQFSSLKASSRTESYSPGVKQSHIKTSGQIWKSLRTLAHLADLTAFVPEMHEPSEHTNACVYMYF